jgi:hypothetical protein
MSTAAHTPGPWYHVGGADKRAAPYIRAVGDELPGTAAIAQIVARGSHSQHEANAQLIATAPELLEALKYARRMLAISKSECDMDFIDAAITKAAPNSTFTRQSENH